jgi:hypothetical protein
MTAVAAAASRPRVARDQAETRLDNAAASRARGDAAAAAELPRAAVDARQPRAPHDDARAAARPGERDAPRGVDTPAGPRYATGRRLEGGADRIDRMYHRLVDQLDAIRRAVRDGNEGAALEAFGQARQLFAGIVQLANELSGNLVSTGNGKDDAVRRRIGETVRNAYTIAGVIEDEMPGDQTI